jgi:hypothetical protein
MRSLRKATLLAGHCTHVKTSKLQEKRRSAASVADNSLCRSKRLRECTKSQNSMAKAQTKLASANASVRVKEVKLKTQNARARSRVQERKLKAPAQITKPISVSAKTCERKCNGTNASASKRARKRKRNSIIANAQERKSISATQACSRAPTTAGRKCSCIRALTSDPRHKNKSSIAPCETASSKA